MAAPDRAGRGGAAAALGRRPAIPQLRAGLVAAGLAHAVLAALGMTLVMMSALGLGLHGHGGQLSLPEVWADLRVALALQSHEIWDHFVSVAPKGQDAVSVGVVAWFFGLKGAMFLGAVAAGWGALHRPSAARVCAYSLLAAVLLIYMADFGHVLAEMSSWGSLEPRPDAGGGAAGGSGAPRGRSELQRRMFQEGYDFFTKTNDGGKLREVLVELDVCQPGDASLVPVCTAYIRTLHPSDYTAIDSDLTYCQCWCSYFDILRHMMYGYAALWIGMLLGVLGVLANAVRPGLEKMCDRQRSEFGYFTAVSVLVLVYNAASASSVATARLEL